MTARKIIDGFLKYKRKKLTGNSYTLEACDVLQAEYLEMVLKREREAAVKEYKRSIK